MGKLLDTAIVDFKSTNPKKGEILITIDDTEFFVLVISLGENKIKILISTQARQSFVTGVSERSKGFIGAELIKNWLLSQPILEDAINQLKDIN